MIKQRFWLAGIFVAAATLLLWGIWPWMSEHFGNWYCQLLPGIHENAIKEELSQIYTILQALTAVMSIGLAIALYLGGRSQAREDEFNALLMRELDHIFEAVREWTELQDGLQREVEGEMLDGSFVIRAFADKYREDELRLLQLIHGGNEEQADHALVELKRQDSDFMTEFEDANLRPLANVLFRILNWSWAVVGSLERVYAKDGPRMREVAAFQEKIIGIVRDYIGPDAQFVFGKYRHIKWGLDVKFAKGRPAYYRGERSADRLFVYERTLAMYIPAPDIAELQLAALDERNMKLGLANNLRLDVKGIWTSKMVI